MVYAKRFQVRQSTVLVIVLLLMGSVLYEVTRTESMPWQSASARTQDISLPAVEPPPTHSRFSQRVDYLGSGTTASTQVRAALADDVLPWAPRAAAVSSRSAALSRASASRGADVSFSAALAPRVRSSGSSGYSSGGMSGVGAWGGVSGVVRPSATSPTRVATTRTTAAKAPKSSNASSSRSSGSTDASAAPGLALANGFSTGAAAVESGAVVALQTPGASPGSSPASTPEPMSLMLVGTGLATFFGARRYLQ